MAPSPPCRHIWEGFADLLFDELVGIEERPPQRRGYASADAGFAGAAHASQDEIHSAEESPSNSSKNVG